MKLDMKTISTMEAAGLQFIAYIRVPAGSQTVEIEPKEIAAFVANRDEVAAKLFGVSTSQYLDWVATDGEPRCGAITKKGTRCSNFVSGGVQRSIEEWVRLDGGYCAVHGGESSQEARPHRY
ncbi:hypothetical protein RFM23_24170 [Mesorhizobium abyssinicae]|uniref:Uncharacterized protein n=1 Tax=Mesorhizobium abyssinicae TaxID=1209958 RepID=A0ABU5ATS7_9HYPH|nr:hypothetical protein [Mesorhizobium abyssinicae]MDX8540718.1 hypothetical protein [Mesorhizobium abyssinicae]